MSKAPYYASSKNLINLLKSSAGNLSFRNTDVDADTKCTCYLVPVDSADMYRDAMVAAAKQLSNDYHRTICSLFETLEALNTADSSAPVSWTRKQDSCQATGAYGHISDAIISLAGIKIVEHWVETGEVDLTLADR